MSTAGTPSLSPLPLQSGGLSNLGMTWNSPVAASGIGHLYELRLRAICNTWAGSGAPFQHTERIFSRTLHGCLRFNVLTANHDPSLIHPLRFGKVDGLVSVPHSWCQ